MGPSSPYRGKEWTPQRLAFNKNMQTFLNKVSLIVSLETNGKIDQEEAYRRMKALWKTLKRSKKGLTPPDCTDSQKG